MNGVAHVEREVRELVRSRGLDPFQQPEEIDHLIVEVIASYADRSLRESLPPVTDPEATRKLVLDAIVGLGPLQRYLDDDEIEEIWINEPSRVFVARGGAPELTATVLSEEQIRQLVEHMLIASGRRLDLSCPFVDAALRGGERLHVVIPDVTRHWAVNIRKFVTRARRITDLVALGAIGQRPAQFLATAVRAGLTVVVSGSTQSGKTTTLAALAGEIPAGERIVTCEEVFELAVTGRDVVAMQCRQRNLEGAGEISLRRLVVEALRMRPDRLLIGEVRQAEALDLLIALNSGIPGMCTVHANSAREALAKLCTLPLLAGENVPERFVVPTVAGVVDIVVHLARGADGRRRVAQIVGVPGACEGSVIAADELFAPGPDGELTPTGAPPPHVQRFEAIGTNLTELLGR